MAKGTLQIKYEKLVLDNLDLKERVKELETALEAILRMKPQLYAACFPSIIRTAEQALEGK